MHLLLAIFLKILLLNQPTGSTISPGWIVHLESTCNSENTVEDLTRERVKRLHLDGATGQEIYPNSHMILLLCTLIKL